MFQQIQQCNKSFWWNVTGIDNVAGFLKWIHFYINVRHLLKWIEGQNYWCVETKHYLQSIGYLRYGLLEKTKSAGWSILGLHKIICNVLGCVWKGWIWAAGILYCIMWVEGDVNQICATTFYPCGT